MRYLVRPDAAGSRWTLYCSPRGDVLRTDLHLEAALREADELNRKLANGWSAERELARVQRKNELRED